MIVIFTAISCSETDETTKTIKVNNTYLCLDSNNQEATEDNCGVCDNDPSHNSIKCISSRKIPQFTHCDWNKSIDHDSSIINN